MPLSNLKSWYKNIAGVNLLYYLYIFANNWVYNSLKRITILIHLSVNWKLRGFKQLTTTTTTTNCKIDKIIKKGSQNN